MGNPVLLDKVFSLLIISLWDICNKIQMVATKWGRFVMEMFISGRKHETSYFGFLEYGVFKCYGTNMFRP